MYGATVQKTKYNHLLYKIEKIGCIERKNESIINLNIDFEPKVIYIQRSKEENNFQ